MYPLSREHDDNAQRSLNRPFIYITDHVSVSLKCAICFRVDPPLPTAAHENRIPSFALLLAAHTAGRGYTNNVPRRCFTTAITSTNPTIANTIAATINSRVDLTVTITRPRLLPSPSWLLISLHPEGARQSPADFSVHQLCRQSVHRGPSCVCQSQRLRASATAFAVNH